MEKLTKEYIKLANRDLKACKNLYEDSLYPQSIFFFAQSVEKANKALALASGKYMEQDMLEISHDPTRIYQKLIIEQKLKSKKALRRLGEIPELSNLYALSGMSIKSIEQNIKQCESQLQEIGSIQKSKYDPTFLSTKEIQTVLRDLMSFDSDLVESVKELPNYSLSKSEWETVTSKIIEFADNFEQIDDTSLQEIKKELHYSDIDVEQIAEITKKTMLQLFNILRIAIPLYPLSIITMRHSIITRYPDTVRYTKEMYPTKIYTRKLPLVRNLPDLIDLHFRTISHLDKYCSQYVFNQEN